MKEIQLYGYPWLIRSDAVAETQYKAENVSLYSQTNQAVQRHVALLVALRAE